MHRWRFLAACWLGSGRERLAAFESGLESANVEAISNLIKTGPPSFEMGRACATGIIDEGQADALICGGFEISNGALSVIMERGLSPHDPLYFVGYGDPAFYSWVSGGVSTICVPVETLALEAANVLKNWPQSTDDELARSLFPAELVSRPGIA